MFKVTTSTKVYILSSPNYATGGPECLHQLYFKLKSMGKNVFMFYYPTDYIGNPVHEHYKIYSPEYVKEIEDDPNNILIVPEMRTYYLPAFKRIQKGIWWLSVDNYLKSISNTKSKISRLFGFNKYFSLKSKKNRSQISLHLAQSKYAEEFLKGSDIFNVARLSDYSNNKVITMSHKINRNRKENIVLYNPKKGIEVTNRIIESAPNINFQPIENMSYEDVLELIAKSKVYIDFGYHPGKDRLPRECAILDCCVITNKKGSAFYFEDVPIPDDYKLDYPEHNISQIIYKINSCLENYEDVIPHFKEYKKKQIELEKLMENEIENIFKIN